jgi:hypothetical protein
MSKSETNPKYQALRKPGRQEKYNRRVSGIHLLCEAIVPSWRQDSGLAGELSANGKMEFLPPPIR